MEKCIALEYCEYQMSFDFRIESRGRCLLVSRCEEACTELLLMRWIGCHFHISGRGLEEGGKYFCKRKGMLANCSATNNLGFIRRPQVAYLSFNLRSVGYFGWSFQEQTLRREEVHSKDKSIHFWVRRKHDRGFQDDGLGNISSEEFK